MKYIKTTYATNWPQKKPFKVRLLKKILSFIPKANPDYESKMHLVKIWLIEFIEDDGELFPWREIALGLNSQVVFAGPDKRNFGFWLDTNVKFEDFEGELIDKSEFEFYWKKSGINVPNE